MGDYYAALIAEWPSLTGTTAQKIAAINAMTVAGPNVDVQISSAVGTLMLSGAYLPLAAFAASAATGVVAHDTALGAAKMLMTAITIPNAPPFNMSNPTNYAIIKGMMDAILAEETAAPGTTGFTQAVHDALLALATTTIPWWQAANGGGLDQPVGLGYVNNAGLS